MQRVSKEERARRDRLRYACRKQGGHVPGPNGRCQRCNMRGYRKVQEAAPHPTVAARQVIATMTMQGPPPVRSEAPPVADDSPGPAGGVMPVPSETPTPSQEGAASTEKDGPSSAPGDSPEPAVVVNLEAQSTPVATPPPASTPRAASAPSGSAAPADVVNVAAGAAGDGAPVAVQKPSVQIPAALVRAGLAGGLSWVAEKGAAYCLRNFGPKGKKGELFRPGPATWTISDEMLDKFGVSVEERRTMGVTPTEPMEYPVSDIMAEGVRIELERLGMTKDVNIHPLIVVFVGLVAIPATMVVRSPDFQDALKEDQQRKAPLAAVDDPAAPTE